VRTAVQAVDDDPRDRLRGGREGRRLQALGHASVDEAGAHDRFLREARLATKINHPNVAALYDFSTLQDASRYMVWEYIEGINLHELIESRGPLSPRYAARLAIEALLAYDWPGNVRELENIIERAVILSDGGSALSLNVNLPGAPSEARAETFQQAKNKTVSQFERDYIQKLLLAHGGNITAAARAARKNRRAFWELIRKHRIDVSRYKTIA